MEIVVAEFLKWLSRYLPSFLAAFGLGYKMGQKGEAEAKKKLLATELNLDLEKNKNKILTDNLGKSDLDVVNDLVGRTETGSDNKTE